MEIVQDLWTVMHHRADEMYHHVAHSPLAVWLAAAPQRAWQALTAVGAGAGERLQEARDVAVADFNEVRAGVVVRAVQAKQRVLNWPALQVARGMAVQGYHVAAAQPLAVVMVAAAVALGGGLLCYLMHHSSQIPTEELHLFSHANTTSANTWEIETRFSIGSTPVWVDTTTDLVFSTWAEVTVGRWRPRSWAVAPLGAFADVATIQPDMCPVKAQEWNLTGVLPRLQVMADDFARAVGEERTSGPVWSLAGPRFGSLSMKSTNTSVGISVDPTPVNDSGAEQALVSERRQEHEHDSRDDRSTEAGGGPDNGRSLPEAELDFVSLLPVCAAAAGAEVLTGRRTCQLSQHGRARGDVTDESRRGSRRSASAAGAAVKPGPGRTINTRRSITGTEVDLCLGPGAGFGTLPRRSWGGAEAVRDLDDSHYVGDVLVCAAHGLRQLYGTSDAHVCHVRMHLHEALLRCSREGFEEVQERDVVAAVPDAMEQKPQVNTAGRSAGGDDEAFDSLGQAPGRSRGLTQGVRGLGDIIRHINEERTATHGDHVHKRNQRSEPAEGEEERPRSGGGFEDVQERGVVAAVLETMEQKPQVKTAGRSAGGDDEAIDSLRQAPGRSRGLTQGVRGLGDIVRPINEERTATHDEPPRKPSRGSEPAEGEEERPRRMRLPGSRSYAVFSGRGAAVAGYINRRGRRCQRITVRGAVTGVSRMAMGLGLLLTLVVVAFVVWVFGYRRRLRDDATSNGPDAAGDGQGPSHDPAQTATTSGAATGGAGTGQQGAGAGGPQAGSAGTPDTNDPPQPPHGTGDPAIDAALGGGAGGGAGADQQQPGQEEKKKKKKKNGKKAASMASADGAPGAGGDTGNALSGEEQSGAATGWKVQRETLPLGAATTDIPATEEKLRALLDQAPTSTVAKRALFELLYELVTTTVFDARYLNQHNEYKERRQQPASAEELDQWCARQVACHVLDTLRTVDTFLGTLRIEEEKMQSGAAATHDGVMGAGQQQEAGLKAVEDKVVAERDRLLLVAACAQHGYRRMYRVLCETGDLHRKRLNRFKEKGVVFGED